MAEREVAMSEPRVVDLNLTMSGKGKGFVLPKVERNQTVIMRKKSISTGEGRMDLSGVMGGKSDKEGSGDYGLGVLAESDRWVLGIVEVGDALSHPKVDDRWNEVMGRGVGVTLDELGVRQVSADVAWSDVSGRSFDLRLGGVESMVSQMLVILDEMENPQASGLVMRYPMMAIGAESVLEQWLEYRNNERQEIIRFAFGHWTRPELWKNYWLNSVIYSSVVLVEKVRTAPLVKVELKSAADIASSKGSSRFFSPISQGDVEICDINGIFDKLAATQAGVGDKSGLVDPKIYSDKIGRYGDGIYMTWGFEEGNQQWLENAKARAVLRRWECGYSGCCEWGAGTDGFYEDSRDPAARDVESAKRTFAQRISRVGSGDLMGAAEDVGRMGQIHDDFLGLVAEVAWERRLSK